MTDKKMIGRGRTAAIYEWDEGKVIKVFEEWFQPAWVTYEADIGRQVFSAGVPAPEVFEETTFEGKPAVVYRRIEGQSLLKLIGQKPLGMMTIARNMAALHAEIHSHRAPGLPSQKDKLGHCLNSAGELLTDAVRERFKGQLAAMPDSDRVCHGDFHPDNIMATPGGLITIDWGNAWRGNPLTDVARTVLMFSTPYRIPGRPLMVAFLEGFLRKKMLDTYLDHYCRVTGTQKREVLALLPLMAAARLHEKVPGEEGWLLGLLDRKDTI
jgi:aminoglycoside phosphotransferase (APT) family kinase protein